MKVGALFEANDAEQSRYVRERKYEPTTGDELPLVYLIELYCAQS